MKKIALFLGIVLFYIISYAQSSVIDKCLDELEPILKNANKVWVDGNTHYGMTAERAERYAFYCMSACDVIDKYINQIYDIDEKIDMLWTKVDLLSGILEMYETSAKGLSKSQYDIQSKRKVTALELISHVSNEISDKIDRILEQYDVEEALGEFYFNSKNYKEAQRCYSTCVSKYNDLLTNGWKDTKSKKMGQKAYYWLGYSHYKLGETAIAKNYFDKAKTILNDDLIQGYK